MKLFHYTCDHRIKCIRAQRWLTPFPQIQLPGKPEMIWLTDLDVPDRLGLGLTSYNLTCDRTAHRITVVAADHEATPWTAYARGMSGAARRVVEDCPGVLPMHWWVASVPLPVLEVRDGLAQVDPGAASSPRPGCGGVAYPPAPQSPAADVASREESVSREWVIVVNAPDVWLTANKPKSRWARGPLAAAWRRAAYQTAIAAKLPKGLVRVRIEPVARFRAGRRPVRDTPNLAPTVKAAIDGLGPQDRGKTAAGRPWIAPGYGLIGDDDDKHLDLAAVVIGDPLPAVRYGSAGELILTIREVNAR